MVSVGMALSKEDAAAFRIDSERAQQASEAAEAARREPEAEMERLRAIQLVVVKLQMRRWGLQGPPSVRGASNVWTSGLSGVCLTA